MRALSLVILLGCSHVPVQVQQGIDCTTAAAVHNLPAAIAAVSSALGGNANGWQSAVDTAYATFGDAAICAIEQLVKDAEGQKVNSAKAEVAFLRGKLWLLQHGIK